MKVLIKIPLEFLELEICPYVQCLYSKINEECEGFFESKECHGLHFEQYIINYNDIMSQHLTRYCRKQNINCRISDCEYYCIFKD